MKTLVLSIALLSLSYVARATEAPTVALSAKTADEFNIVATSVRQEMRRGGQFGDLNDRDKRRVEAGLEEMRGLLARHGDVDSMNPRQKARLFSKQEEVNGLLTGQQADRLISASRSGAWAPT